MIGYMWVKYKYRIGIVFCRKTMHRTHAKTGNTFSGQSLSHIPSPLFAGQPLLEPLFGLLLSVSLPLAGHDLHSLPKTFLGHSIWTF